MDENNPTSQISGRSNEFLLELLKEIADPIHNRLIKAYHSSDPINSMETELGKILMEVLTRED